VISALRDFVPVTGNTHDLQNRRSELGAWFMKTVSSVNARVEQGHTTQGFYVVAADGTAYGFNNNRSVERVLAFMADGLKKFRTNPPQAPTVPVLEHKKLAPPEGASVLRVYSRIVPTPEGCNESNKNLQRDHLWVLPAEARALAAGQVPEPLQLRLCRFTLVDAVRGEPDFWQEANIESKSFSVVNGPNGRCVSGKFAMKSARQTLQGDLELVFTVREGKLVTAKGYAACTASGSGTWTPGAPDGTFPLKFAFVMAPESKDTVPPQAAMYGREYLTGK
jgi:hypothetical protein